MKQNYPTKPNSLFTCLAFGAAALFSGLSSQAEDALFIDKVISRDEITVSSDLWYGPGTPDLNQRLYLDVYQPSGDSLPAGLPALVYIHGGAFITGAKTDQPAPLYCYEFAHRGYVVFSINYTLDNTAVSAALDAAKAIRWVKANAATYNVDPDKIIVGGHSAGAVTALRVGCLEADELGGSGAEVAGVLVAAGSFIEDIEQVDIGDPPMFIINGTADTMAPVERSRNLVARLNSLGDATKGMFYPYQYMEVAGAGHGFIPGNGLGFTPPAFAGSPQDEFKGWSNTEIDDKTVEAHCFEFFFEQLSLSGDSSPSDTDPVVSVERNSTSKPVNISTLARLRPGDQITAGVVINGVQNQTLLFRGVGSGLGGYVSDPLPKAVIELYRVSPTSNQIATSSTVTTQAIELAAEVGAATAADAAIVATLSPGIYTVVLKGVDNGVGSALVEIYEID